MVQSWLILSPFVLVPGALAEQRFYGAHCLCGTGGCFVSICEMALQLLQWRLPPMGKHVLGEDESSPTAET